MKSEICVAKNNEARCALFQNIGDAILPDEAAEISARHAEVPDAVRKL